MPCYNKQTYAADVNLYDSTTDGNMVACAGGGINYQSLFGGCAAKTSQTPEPVSFDTETQWGSSKEHKVKEVEFERKEVIYSFDIFYSSRKSLMEKGIISGTEKRVSFPESFKESKYAKPPKGWQG